LYPYPFAILSFLIFVIPTKEESQFCEQLIVILRPFAILSF
jgi:hypothetical protein